MFILATIALIAGGLALGAVLANYWDRIRNWLNNTAADAVEHALGSEARRNLFKAVSVADKIFRIIQGNRVAVNVSTVYARKSSQMIDKTIMITEIPAEELGNEYLNELKNSSNVMEMDYVH